MTPEVMTALDNAARALIRSRREVLNPTEDPDTESENLAKAEFERDQALVRYYAARMNETRINVENMYLEALHRALDMSIRETESIICG